MVTMTANGSGPQQAFAPVLAALATMRDGQREQKIPAHQFLESFQKSVRQKSTQQAKLPTRLTIFTDGGMADDDWHVTIPG